MRRGLSAIMAGLVLMTEVALAHDSGFGLARYAGDGVLDRSFGSNGLVVMRSAQRSFVASALALQPDGKILLGGMSSDLSSGTIQLALARYNSDGSADQTFAGGMIMTPVGEGGAQANALALQPDGMVLVVGTAFSHGSVEDEFFVARYDSAGALDTRFGTGGIVRTHVGAAASSASALALRPDGRIVVVGTAFSNAATDDDFALAGFTSTGQLDAEFGSGGIVTTDFGSSVAVASLDRATAVTLQPDGKIVVAGFTRGARQSFVVARYQSDGSLDMDFGSGGKAHVLAAEPQVSSIVLESSGDIVLAGSSASSTRGTAPFTLVRLHSDGQPDETFGSAGLVTTSFEGSRSGARAVVAQPDGNLVVAGAKFGAPSAQGDAQPDSGFALARFTPDGRMDATFGVGGKALTDMGDAGATPLSLAIQADGKILAAGLVFFQVPAAGPTGVFDSWARIGGIAAAVGLAVALVVVSRLVRRLR